jgi:hypothetical protein
MSAAHANQSCFFVAYDALTTVFAQVAIGQLIHLFT